MQKILSILTGIGAALLLGSFGFLVAGFLGLLAGTLLGIALGLFLYQRGRVTSTPVPPKFPNGQIPECFEDVYCPAEPEPPHVPRIPEAFVQRKKENPRWVCPGEAISAGQFKIESGFFYITNGYPETEDASNINLRLPIGRPVAGAEAQLGYYSHYSQLSPNQRATYLDWLANSRTDADPTTRNPGYVFLFFYGLERRLLVDKDNTPELIAEIVRLLQQYGTGGRSRSLQNYSCQLIHFWGWRQGAEYYSQLWDWIETLPVSLLGNDELALVLANHFQRNKPLTAKLAYEVISRDPMTRKTVVVRRVNAEFRALFLKRYAEQIPSGIFLKAAKSEICIEYRPANPSLMQLRYQQREKFTVSVPNVLGLSSQFKPLALLWESCIEDLTDYSREKGKPASDGAELKGHLALPRELREITVHPLSAQWRKLMETATSQNDCSFVSAGEVCQLAGFPKRDKLTVSQSRELANTIESLGFGVVPDARYDNIAYSWEQEIAVFQPVDGKFFPPTPVCVGAAALLELCVMVSGADGEVDETELDVFRKFVGQQLGNNVHDLQRLRALEQLLVHNVAEAKISLSRIAKRVNANQRELIGEVLVLVAAADNVITKEEQKALERIFKAFELPIEKLYSLIQAVRSATAEVTIQQSEPGLSGEPIPRARGASVGFKIDMSRVEQVAQETAEVIGILSRVMSEESPAVEPVQKEEETRPEEASSVPPQGIPDWLNSLETKYQLLALRLVERPSWPRTDFEALAREYQLMALNVYDTINEWSDEHLGDFLLEGEDPIIIHQKLIPGKQLS